MQLKLIIRQSEVFIPFHSVIVILMVFVLDVNGPLHLLAFLFLWLFQLSFDLFLSVLFLSASSISPGAMLPETSLNLRLTLLTSPYLWT